MKLGFWIVVLYCAVLGHPSQAAVWAVTKHIHLEGDGGWDYLTADSAARKLYVSHGMQVLVLDLDTGRVLTRIPANGVHGIALARELNRGFISNGGNGTVTLFDLKSSEAIASVKAGQNPDAICYEPKTQRVFAFNGRSQTVSVLDAATTGMVTGTIPLPGKPEFAAADAEGSVFDAIEDKALLIRIDAATLAITQQWALPAKCEPSALAMDKKEHRLFVGCGDKTLRVVDSASGRVVSSIPIGTGVDAVAFDPKRHRVFASCRDGTLTVVDQRSANNYSIEAVVPTAKGARTMAVDESTGDAYLPSAQFGPLPPATPKQPKPRPPVLSGTLELLVMTPEQDR